MDEALRQLVRLPAGGQCECRLLRQEHEALLPFHIEHVIASQHGGQSTEDNLALSCAWCNFVKGPNIASLDPATGKLTRLFHPRRDCWEDHFRKDGPRIAGKTDVGRTTVQLLRMNDADAVDQRCLLIELGEW
jgi:HNH endonuclease